MAIDNVYQHLSTFGSGGLRVEAGDISYAEASMTTNQYIHIETRLNHVVMGMAFPDSTRSATMRGRASPRIGDISGGMCAFSLSDATVTNDDQWTYFILGW